MTQKIVIAVHVLIGVHKEQNADFQVVNKPNGVELQVCISVMACVFIFLELVDDSD